MSDNPAQPANPTFVQILAQMKANKAEFEKQLARIDQEENDLVERVVRRVDQQRISDIRKQINL